MPHFDKLYSREMVYIRKDLIIMFGPLKKPASCKCLYHSWTHAILTAKTWQLLLLWRQNVVLGKSKGLVCGGFTIVRY